MTYTVVNHRAEMLRRILEQPAWTKSALAKLLSVHRDTVNAYTALGLLIEDYDRATPKDANYNPITNGLLNPYQAWVVFKISLHMQELYTTSRGSKTSAKAKQDLIRPELARKLSFEVFKYECNLLKSIA